MNTQQKSGPNWGEPYQPTPPRSVGLLPQRFAMSLIQLVARKHTSTAPEPWILRRFDQRHERHSQWIEWSTCMSKPTWAQQLPQQPSLAANPERAPGRRRWKWNPSKAGQWAPHWCATCLPLDGGYIIPNAGNHHWKDIKGSSLHFQHTIPWEKKRFLSYRST